METIFLFNLICISGAFLIWGVRHYRFHSTLARTWQRIPAIIIGTKKQYGIGNKTFFTQVRVRFQYHSKHIEIMSLYKKIPEKYVTNNGETEVLVCPDDITKSLHYIPSLYRDFCYKPLVILIRLFTLILPVIFIFLTNMIF